MSPLPLIAEAMLSVVLVIGVGALIRRVGWLTTAADTSLLALVVNLLTPCLILDKVMGSSALERASTVLLAPAAGIVLVSVCILIALLVGRLFKVGAPPVQRSFALAAGLQNYGYFALPLALSLFGGEGNETVAVLFVHNLGVEVALWTLGIVVLSGTPPRDALKRLINAPSCAIVVALILNSTVGRTGVPAVLLKSVSLIGSAAIPVGLLLTGATMVDHARGVFGPGGLRTAVLGCILRLGVLPLVYCLALWTLPASVELQRVFVLQAAMPAAVSPIILSKHYGGDSLTALRVVFATSLVALLTIPIWIHFGLKWVSAP